MRVFEYDPEASPPKRGLLASGSFPCFSQFICGLRRGPDFISECRFVRSEPPNGVSRSNALLRTDVANPRPVAGVLVEVEGPLELPFPGIFTVADVLVY